MCTLELLTLNRLGYFANKDGWGGGGGVFFTIDVIILSTLNRLGYFANKDGWGGVFFTIGFILLSSELLTLNRLGYFANKEGRGERGGVFFTKEKK